MIHITCNMGSQDLPDIYALSPRASGIHIRQIPPTHVTTYTQIMYILVCSSCSRNVWLPENLHPTFCNVFQLATSQASTYASIDTRKLSYMLPKPLD